MASLVSTRDGRVRASLRPRRLRGGAVFRLVTFTIAGVFFGLPLVAMVDFTTRDPAGGRTLQTWATLINVSKINKGYPDLKNGLVASLGLAVVSVSIMLVLLLPTMTWVRLRLPRLVSSVRFVCLLPLSIPSIVLVVGLVPVYAWVTYFLGSSTIWLCFCYVVLILPFAYGALDAGLSAIDVKTLSEAARSLGASWFMVFRAIVVPNMGTAVMSAAFLGVALVLGEFTVANLLSRTNLQVAIYQLGRSDASMSIAVALCSLIFAFGILFVMSFVGNRRRRPADAPPSRES